jgi:hypothetical protein
MISPSSSFELALELGLSGCPNERLVNGKEGDGKLDCVLPPSGIPEEAVVELELLEGDVDDIEPD